jgi:glycosyltransferase involved in cell wall biosynthesis
LRILHVLPAYYPATRYGGPVVAVHGLARAMVSRGHSVEVMTTNADGAGSSDVPLNEPVTRDGVRIRYFAPTTMRRIFWARDMTLALRAEVTSFDVVHIHQMYHWPAWMTARAAQAHNVPYVVSPRGMLVKEMIARRSYVAKTAWISLFDRPSLERAAAIHATSELEQAELERFDFNWPPVTAIPNGVDDPLPVPAKEAMPLDIGAATATRPVVLYLGRLNWKKGLERLVRAFAGTLKGVLVIAGPDEGGQSGRLAMMAHELGAGHRVHILPRVIDEAEREFLFAAARVFVLPSYSENFGNTVIEAMRRGVPVITTPQVGTADIVRRAGGGIVTGGEPEALRYAMARFINHPSLARSMGAAGRSHATQHFGWPQVAERMEAFYAGLTK